MIGVQRDGPFSVKVTPANEAASEAAMIDVEWFQWINASKATYDQGLWPSCW